MRKLESVPLDLSAVLPAGRRAAYAELHGIVSHHAGGTWVGPPPEAYDGQDGHHRQQRRHHADDQRRHARGGGAAEAGADPRAAALVEAMVAVPFGGSMPVVAAPSEKPVTLPKMFMVRIQMRCDCDAGEILTESIMLPWDTPSEHVGYLVAKAVRIAKEEAADHLVKRKNAPQGEGGTVVRGVLYPAVKS